jgi:ADP-ribose pyrophosphatase
VNQPLTGTPSVHRETLIKGAKFDFDRLTMQTADGRTLVRQSVRHPGAVLILPLLADPAGGAPTVIMIRNWRISIQQWLHELPAGTLEPGEDPAACAARELEEETGYSAATITPLCRFYTSPGLSDELMWAYVAAGLRPVGQRLEQDEWVTVHPMPAAAALGMIDTGELIDAKSILTLLYAQKQGLLGRSGL